MNTIAAILTLLAATAITLAAREILHRRKIDDIRAQIIREQAAYYNLNQIADDLRKENNRLRAEKENVASELRDKNAATTNRYLRLEHCCRSVIAEVAGMSAEIESKHDDDVEEGK